MLSEGYSLSNREQSDEFSLIKRESSSSEGGSLLEG